MRAPLRPRDERGFAFVLVILIALVLSTLAATALLLGTNARLIARAHERQDLLESVADDGLERGRATLNAEPALYPDTGGFVVLEDTVPVTDALGNPVPGVLRATYAGPIGITSGEYGVFGSIVSVAWDRGGARAVRRLHVVQESFSKYAYFTDVEPDGIAFGGGDEIWGPVHTNGDVKIYASGATFHSSVSTAGVVLEAPPTYRRSYGRFLEGYRERVPPIPMPQTADLQRLESQAAAGGTRFTSSFVAAPGRATLRIEFVALDLNGDGDTQDDDEGFLRAYRAADPDWVVGAAPEGNLRGSRTCGHFHPDGRFVAAADHPGPGGSDDWIASVTNSRRRCFLGGDSTLFNGFQPSDGTGEWLRWSGPVDSRLAGRADAAYLFPITRALNPNFKGVVYVDGDVAVSGVLRGRVTVAATGDIVIADDLTYATNPSAGTCVDILGLFSARDVVIPNTPIHAPWQRGNGSSAYFSYDDTDYEEVHAFVLALNQFWVESYDTGSTRDQRCENIPWGRGCLYLTGGIVQRTRGPVGTTAGTGYLKRYAYDACGVLQPPPYFPTTGRFARAQYLDVDPTGFDPEAYFRTFQAGR